MDSLGSLGAFYWNKVQTLAAHLLTDLWQGTPLTLVMPSAPRLSYY